MRERRRHPRISAKGAVVIRVAGSAHHGRIADISEGGVYVLTSVTPPERWLARDAELQLRLDGASAEWLTGTGRVVRITAGGLALGFDKAPARLGRVLDDLTAASRARRRVLAVVLIDTDAQRRSAMVSGFRAVGCTVVEASSPLEAIVRLGESSFEPDVIAIADSQPGEAADALRAFVAQNHPHAKLVTIVSDLLPVESGRGRVSSHDPDADLQGRIRTMLSQLLAV